MDIEKAVKNQRRFFDTGRTREYSFRRTALLKLQVSLRRYEGELCKALQKDLRKSASESMMAEIMLTQSELKFQLAHLRQWVRPLRVPTPLSQFPAISSRVPEPYGVTLIMAPWNYPVLLCLEPVISAIAAGNCAILKPSAYAPAVSKILAKILSEIYPSKYILVVEGGREENTMLLEQRYDKIFFTGGAEVGRLVLRKAAEQITPVTLELGGKSPVVVDKTANLKLAAKRIAFGKILNSGQTCVAPDYLLIEECVKEKFLTYYEKELEEMLGSQPFKNQDYPRMVNEKHYKRVMRLIQTENIRIGGYGDRTELQIVPTVVDEVTLDSPIMKEEIFGPVLPILTYQTKEELLAVIRHFEKPLACYLFTRDRSMAHWLLRRVSFGGGCINDTIIHLATSYMGFGGVGQSGMGSYHGKDGFDCFSHYKSIVQKANWLDFPMRYHPYKPWNDKIIRRFM